MSAFSEAPRDGIRGDIVDNIREKRPLTTLDPDEPAAVDFTRELLQNGKGSRATVMSSPRDSKSAGPWR